MILSGGGERRCWSYHRGALFWQQESDSQRPWRGARGSLGCWGDLAPLSQPWFSDLHNGNEQSTPTGDNSDDLMNLVWKQSNQGQKSTYCRDSLCIQHESRQNSPGVRKSGESESAWSEHGVGGWGGHASGVRNIVILNLVEIH